jgi:YjbR
MISTANFTQMALKLSGTTDSPHFNRVAFKVTGKRIFATLLPEDSTVNLFLPPEVQSELAAVTHGVTAIPNKWGAQGWTTFDLAVVPPKVLEAALLTAYEHANKPKRPKK